MHVLNKIILTTAIACATEAAYAADATSVPNYTLTANVAFTSQYVYRGITQSASKPAIQGGFDFSHSSGFYLGTWGSSISWYSDNVTNTDGTKNSVSMEWDLYGGYKNAVGDLGYDVGVLQYYYPGHYGPLPAGVTKPNTTEIYGALSYAWLTGKVSYVVSSGLFGVDNARDSYYLDLSANYPITDTWTINAHVGNQYYSGSNAGISNDSLYSYVDYKLGVTKDLGSGWSAAAYYTDTDAKDAGYKILGANSNNNQGDAHYVAAISRTF